jgi:hypothetical protein
MSDRAMKVQAQIRQNAEEVSSYLADMAKWQKSIGAKDKKMTTKKGVRNKATPVRVSVNSSASISSANSTVGGQSTTFSSDSANVKTEAIAPATGKAATAAKHTYDVGYKKWENIDIDALIKEQEDDAWVGTSGKNKKDEDEVTPEIEEGTGAGVDEIEAYRSTTTLTPATIVDRAKSAPVIAAPVARARGQLGQVDPEAAERERGNSEFKKGNFAAAVKSYTRCLGLKSRNYVAFSNRAMANIKLKDFVRAELDCTCALQIESGHVKSLVRRATARSAQGKLRAAVLDLLRAQDLENPPSKSVVAELTKTRELLKNAVSRAPLVRVPISNIMWEGGEDNDRGENGIDKGKILEGPELPAYDEARVPKGHTRVNILIEDDEASEENKGEGGKEIDEDFGTKVEIEMEDGDDKAGNKIKYVAESLPVASLTSSSSSSSRAAKEVQKVKTPTTAVGSSTKTKSKKEKMKTKLVAVKTAYELERLLANAKGNKKATKELFESRIKPKHLPALLSSMLEADVLHSLLMVADSYSEEWPTSERLSFMCSWMDAVTSDATQRSVQLLVSLLTKTQHSDLTKLIHRLTVLEGCGDEEIVRIDRLSKLLH